MQKISIIIPVYNVEQYLDKCIKSVMQQTYQNIEIILVDDGSTDSSGDICDVYSKRDERIKVFHKVNGGLSDARNYGLSKSTGELFMFVDSDDFIHLQAVEKMYSKLLDDKSDLVICEFEKVNVLGNPLEVQDMEYTMSTRGVLTGDEILEQIAKPNGSRYVPAWNKLYTFQAWKGVMFPVGRIHEDEYVIHKVLANCKRVSIIDDNLYYYVQREGSIVHKPTDKNRLDITRALLERAEFYLERKQIENARYCFEGALDKMLNRKAKREKHEECLVKQEIRNIRKKNVCVVSSNKDKIKYILCLYFEWIYRLLQYIKVFRRILMQRCKDNCIKNKLAEYRLKQRFKKMRKKHSVLVILLATPIHGNLGDQAIVCAEKKFLLESGFDNIIEVVSTEYEKFKDIIRKLVLNEDKIIVTGGGNMGTLWTEEDNRITDIVSEFSNNSIVVFPQTCYYSEGKQAQRRLEKNRVAYSKCSNLTIALRDRSSFEYVMKEFPMVDAIFVPDIVLSYVQKVEDYKRDYALLCFRKDKEKYISDDIITFIKKMLSVNAYRYIETDTVISGYVYPRNRQKKLDNKLKEFKKAKIVITDRLHAMIFCAITKTPCIALDNINSKISGVYEWIQNLNYIICVKNIDINEELIKKLTNQKDCDKNDIPNTLFEELKNRLTIEVKNIG